MFLALLMLAPSPCQAEFIKRPPDRFITNGTVLLRTTDSVRSVCKGEYDNACSAGTVIVTDNPCRYPKEVYATRLCHEMAHALMGWKHE